MYIVNMYVLSTCVLSYICTCVSFNHIFIVSIFFLATNHFELFISWSPNLNCCDEVMNLANGDSMVYSWEVNANAANVDGDHPYNMTYHQQHTAKCAGEPTSWVLGHHLVRIGNVQRSKRFRPESMLIIHFHVGRAKLRTTITSFAPCQDPRNSSPMLPAGKKLGVPGIRKDSC